MSTPDTSTAQATQLRNPYLEVFLKYMRPPQRVLGAFMGYEARTDWCFEDGFGGPKWDRHMIDELNGIFARHQLVRRFAWAVPSTEAIEAIAELGKPVLEIGAGLGYWGWLLQQLDVDVELYDREPEDETTWSSIDIEPWLPVREGTEDVLLERNGWPDHALLLCWPPYKSTMPERCLERFAGDTLIHVGEHGGCTARDEFYEQLPVDADEPRNGWRLERGVAIPQWYGIHDLLTIYRR